MRGLTSDRRASAARNDHHRGRRGGDRQYDVILIYHPAPHPLTVSRSRRYHNPLRSDPETKNSEGGAKEAQMGAEHETTHPISN